MPRPRPRGSQRGVVMWESEPLSDHLVITGNVIVGLATEIPQTGTELFVYLEEVDSAGLGHLVTEGQLDLRHGNLVPGPTWMGRMGFHHSYRRADIRVAGRLEATAVEMLPMSHRFARGNRVRLVMTRADKDHFPVPVGATALWLTQVAVLLPVER